MPLEIKVGHRYRTRSGDVVEVTGTRNSPDYPFAGLVISNTRQQYLKAGDTDAWAKNGRWARGAQSYADLIEELPADAPA